MLSFSNAKINLGLNIIEKRSDGYHNIESVFYPIEWCDILEVLPSTQFSFESTGLSIPGDWSQNLIVKAYRLLVSEGFIQEGNSVKIMLHKILPMGAGIGGGSSNGAFALKLINSVLNLNLSNAQLEKFAENLGSDCPFFIENKAKFCFGKGTEFKAIDLSLNGKGIVMVNPGLHISTQEAYSSIVPKKPKESIEKIISEPIANWKDRLVNDFEVGVLDKYPLISEIKETLYQNGALYASMTGSGSTVYGIFEDGVDLSSVFSSYVYWSGTLK